jgi:site-specific recombinase XerD
MLGGMRKHSPEHRSKLLQIYHRHLEEVRGLATITRRHHLEELGRFLEAESIGKVADLARLTPVKLTGYLSVRSTECKPATLRQIAGCLRSFLRFAQQRAWVKQPLSLATPKIACREHHDLPCYLSEEQLESLLSSWDGHTVKGRRDRAIGLCLARLGMRASEVRALVLEDLDWRQGTVRLRRSKNGIQAELPLPHEVGQEIAAYLKADRPACNYREVFLRYPSARPLGPSGVSYVVRKALKACGIQVPRPGAHLLRHTVASHLVQNGATLKEVADLLRHHQLNTTVVYTHLDIVQLRSVAQPWPREARL